MWDIWERRSALDGVVHIVQPDADDLAWMGERRLEIDGVEVDGPPRSRRAAAAWRPIGRRDQPSRRPGNVGSDSKRP